MQGSKRTSVLLKPGTRPGRRGACSLAMFITYFRTFSTVSEGTVGGLSHCEIPLYCHVCRATHHCPSNVLQGCKTHSFWWNVKTKMSSCKFSNRGRKRTFAEVSSSSLFCPRRSHYCNLRIFESLPKWQNQVPWRIVQDSCSTFFKTSLIVIPQLHASSSSALNRTYWLLPFPTGLFQSYQC